NAASVAESAEYLEEIVIGDGMTLRAHTECGASPSLPHRDLPGGRRIRRPPCKVPAPVCQLSRHTIKSGPRRKFRDPISSRRNGLRLIPRWPSKSWNAGHPETR